MSHLAGYFLDADTRELQEVHRDTALYDRAMEWLRFHDLDPMRIPAETVVIRYGRERRIECLYLRLDADGRPVIELEEFLTDRHIEQGEAPPLPIPTVPQETR